MKALVHQNTKLIILIIRMFYIYLQNYFCFLHLGVNFQTGYHKGSPAQGPLQL